jgi:pyruvate, water dikinase
MQKKEAIDVSEKYIKWLSELNKNSGNVAGGKGASLAEMYNAGMPVPPAFVVTAQAFAAFIGKAGLKDKIKDIIAKTNVDNTAELEKNARKIRNHIIDAEMPKDMQEEITEAYSILGTSKEVKEAQEKRMVSRDALGILSVGKEPVFVAVRSSATTEDLATASFAGQQDTYTNIKGNNELIKAVKRCFASLYTARAVYYRHKKGFEKADALLAVVVQRMVNSDKSGVMFTRNPITQEEEMIIEAVFGLGEGIVSGKVKPDHYVVDKELKIKSKKIANKKLAIVRMASGKEKEAKLTEEKSKQRVLTDAEIVSLANVGLKIEEHYKVPQDIEFAVDAGEIYIVQSRPVTTLEVKRPTASVQGEVLLTGLGASPGVASGRVKIIETMQDLAKIKEGDVLVTKMTNPDMVVTMQKSAAVVTDEGGATAHAAIVSREMGIPCIVGTEKATSILKDGLVITVDGSNGKVHEGASGGEIGKVIKKEVLPIIKGTKTKIKVMVDLPDFAERAAKSQAEAVGLLRLEGIIASSGKHPMGFLQENNTQEYSEIIEKGISVIAKYFQEVWIRTSDIRSDEYRNLKGAPKEQEVNPMLGFHGLRFSLKHLPILEAELAAIKRTAENNPDKKFGIMFPQVMSEEEMKEVYKIVHEKYNRPNILIGAMIETPASVQIIRKICKYVKFISFGTNDLTQYTLAIDRGNTDVQYLYDEMHPAILTQLRRVIQICKEYDVESSICGQAGSRKDMVEYLVRQGIDSISVNADVAKEISEFVDHLEAEIKKIKKIKQDKWKQKRKEQKLNKQKAKQQASKQESEQKQTGGQTAK